MLHGIEVRLNYDYFEHKKEMKGIAEKIIYTGVESGKGLVYNAILILKIWFISAAALYVLYCLRKFLIFFLKREEITPEKVEDTGDNTKLI